MGYNPIKIEEKWRKRWEKEGTFAVDVTGQSASRGKPYYNLMMFPYPSAEGLHIGNMYSFTGSDIHGRYMRMRGFDVFEPMGFDSFGIHSENFAIKKGEHPKELTYKNIKHFRDNQLKRMGAIFDWDHEVVTSDPEYYKWTQWLFLQLYKAGLAYRAKAAVDWCASCKTVLADEQVIGGKCERCDTEVIQKELEQWFLKITAYAEKLLGNLEKIDWSPVVKTIQRNWIGRSEGFLLQFPIPNSQFPITIFTTRPDTLFGATYIVLAPEHALIGKLKDKIENWEEVQKYIEDTRKKTEIERKDVAKSKTGVEIKGIRAINPANKEEIPLWVADYVLASYGTGAVMAVPAHDQRDFEFATRYNLPIREVVSSRKNAEKRGSAYEGEGVMTHSGKFDGMSSEEAKEKIAKFAGGKKEVNYHLRDWLISRQRYWGPPIPIIYCDKCGVVPVPEEDLPVELPYVEDFKPTGTDKAPLATVEDFVKTTCPKCKGEARRETDVSDTFLDSAWYFLRYPSAKKKDKPFDKALTKKWLPVDMYVGGKEHAVLHLMYARFVTMALHDAGYIDFEEPFGKFRAHGLLIREGAKMSKSRGNVISPDEYFDSYGADVLRMYLMFLGPYAQGGDWQDAGIAGIQRFLKRVWQLVNDYSHESKSQNDQSNPNNQVSKIQSDKLDRLTHKTIKKVTEDIEEMQYNTAIAALMEYLNALVRNPKSEIRNIEVLVKLLAPFSPHLAEELWEQLGNKTSIHSEAWPEYDEKYLVEDTATVIIQVNGKVRGQIEVESESDEEAVKATALKDGKIAAYAKESDIKKVIYIQDKVINFVV